MPVAPPAGSVSDARPSPAFAALALAVLLGLQPVATDLMLPALPALATDLGASMSTAQATMSAMILGFGLAQLFWGPVADRFGRRPVLLTGLSMYALAGAGAALAGDAMLVVAWRTLQGAGLAAAVVCARAMVRDLYEPQQGALVLSRALSGLGLLAIACPTVGGALLALWGWRASLVAMALIGAMAGLLVALRLPETARYRHADATRLRPLLAQLGDTLSHPGFRAWTALMSCSYATLFIFLSGSGYVLIRVLGMTPVAAGLAMSTMSMGYIAGTFLCRRWVLSHGAVGAVRLGARFSIAATLAMLMVAAADIRSLWALMPAVWLFALGHGVHQPCGQVGAVGPFPRSAGLASALAGFTLAVAAFGAGVLHGLSMNHSMRPIALAMAIGAALTATVACTLVQRDGQPAPEPASALREAS